MISTSKIITDKLKQNNCKVIFEYPGGNISPMLDAIKRDGDIELIVTRNDQAAALMADAYARVTDEIGVCMATVGPGATNLITGIANAYCDSIPLVAITGQVATSSLKGNKKTRQLGFQEVDIVSLIKPVTKWATIIKNPEDIDEAIDKAFRIAKEGRPGPVLIDIPMDIQRSTQEYPTYQNVVNMLENIDTTAYSSQIISEKKIKLLLNKLKASQRPVIIAGGGIILSNAEPDLKKFSDKFKIPVANTLMGLGSFNLENKMALGLMGCYGSRFCNQVLAEADMIIAFGNRFDVKSVGTETGKFQEGKFIAHIDIDGAEINNRVKSDLAINADVGSVLKIINNEANNINIDTNAWVNHIANIKSKLDFDAEYNLSENYDRVRPQYIVREISKITKGNAIITTDVGQHQIWAAQFYQFTKTRTHLTSGGLGNMGYGLPAAIAAKYAEKSMYAINITGDGSFQMNMQELGTAIEYNLPVKIFIFKNNTLGMVKQFQDKTFIGKATSTVIAYNPDFAELEKVYEGIKGFRITKAHDISRVVKEAIEYEGPVIVDCFIDENELALPELEGGHYINDQYPYLR